MDYQQQFPVVVAAICTIVRNSFYDSLRKVYDDESVYKWWLSVEAR